MKQNQKNTAQTIAELFRENFHLYPKDYPADGELTQDNVETWASNMWENRNEHEVERDNELEITSQDYTNWAKEELYILHQKQFWNYQIEIGEMLPKIEFWTHRYEFTFQFWGKRKNRVDIMKDDVEVASFTQENSIGDVLKKTVNWCEKANPRIKYPEKITNELHDI